MGAVSSPAMSGLLNQAASFDSHPNESEGASLFSTEELRQFASDDVEAGRRIGKILASLFIYTLLAMGVATWWTLKTLAQ